MVEPAYFLRFRETLVPLGREWIAVGRSATCEVVLDHGMVSRRHARLAVVDGRVLLEDLSTHGVLVAGERVNASRILDIGAKIVIASFELEIVARWA